MPERNHMANEISNKHHQEILREIEKAAVGKKAKPAPCFTD